MTDSILYREGETFLLVAPDLATADEGCAGSINMIYDYALQKGYGFFCLTASDAEDFDISAQPLFHKNFDLLTQECYRFLDDGYKIFILADSQKQIERLKDIFASLERPIPFEPVQRTIHEGFVDNSLKICFFTDHQIFDRFHKYNLKSDKARKGKVALTLKEIQQFEIGDYVVHIDHGVGRFMGLVRVPNGDSFQEMIKISYQNEDTVYVSIHALHKISKYKGKEGEPPRISKLGTGAWERMKERVVLKRKHGVASYRVR